MEYLLTVLLILSFFISLSMFNTMKPLDLHRRPSNTTYRKWLQMLQEVRTSGNRAGSNKTSSNAPKKLTKESQKLLMSALHNGNSSVVDEKTEWLKRLEMHSRDTPGLTTLKIGYLVSIKKPISHSSAPHIYKQRLGAYVSGALVHAIRHMNRRARAAAHPQPSPRPQSFPSNVKRSRYSGPRINNALRDPALPPGYQLDFVMLETYGDQQLSVKHVTDACAKRQVDVIIGMSDTCRLEAEIGSAYNMFMISHACRDFSVYHHANDNCCPTFIRSKAQPTELVYPLISLLHRYNWTSITFVYTKDLTYSFLTEFTLKTFEHCGIKVIAQRAYESPYFYNNMHNPFMDIIQETFSITRIYVLIGAIRETRGFLANMYRRGLLSTGQYFVVGAGFQGPQESNEEILLDVEYRNEPREMFRYYLHLGQTMIVTQEMKDLEIANQKHLSLPPFNLKPLSSIKNIWPQETGYLYDAVFLYATAVGNMVRQNKTQFIKSGRALAGSLLNYTYRSSLGYESRINRMGNAVGQFSVFSLRIDKKNEYKLTKLGTFDKQCKSTGEQGLHRKRRHVPVFLLEPSCHDASAFQFCLVNVHYKFPFWEEPPPHIPPCGFPPNHCAKGHSLLPLILSLGLALISACIIIAAVFGVRNELHKRARDRLIWKIGKDELFVITENSSGKSNGGESLEGLETVASITPAVRTNSKRFGGTIEVESDGVNSALTTGQESPRSSDSVYKRVGLRQTIGTFSFRGSRSAEGQVFLGTCLGMYKKNRVILKGINKLNINVTEAMKTDLKVLIDLSHPNLSKFYGACVDAGAVCAVWECAARGNLCNMLQESTVLNENVFRVSFVSDILRGLGFLHSSDIGYHGNLKPSNCVIDSRWQIKLIHFGLQSLQAGESVSHLSEEEYFAGMLYTAPELLRHLLSTTKSKTSVSGQCGNPYLTALNEELGASENDGNTAFSGTNPSWHMKRPRVFFSSVRDWQRADVYSLGLILFSIFYKNQAFSYKAYPSKEIIRRIVVLNDQFKVPYRPVLGLLSTTDKRMTDCIKMCWSESPTDRPTVRLVIENLKPFLQPDGKEVDMLDNLSQILELYTKDLEVLVVRRAQEVEAEQNRSLELLYEMLPAPVADQLRGGGQVSPEEHDAVTIYFSDLVGFQDVCRTQTPFQVVNILNNVYNLLDLIISAFNVYKVETVGEHYMVASGLPKPNDEHAATIANMALKILREIRTSRILGSFPDVNVSLKPRIGMHSGPCMAGVIGKKMPRYCLFGDTVNTASRMESTGEAGRIQCSEATYIELQQIGGYILQSRGLTQVKGKGRVKTYWLLSSAREINVTNNSMSLGNGPRSPTASLLMP